MLIQVSNIRDKGKEAGNDPKLTGYYSKSKAIETLDYKMLAAPIKL